MAFNAKKYEGQIRAILEAPDVDLSTISAKRVRKQLVEDNAELTSELVKEHKDDFDALISQVYEQVSGTGEAGAEEEDTSEEQVKRKREDEESDTSAAPKKVKKETKKDPHLSDAELARQLSQELNGRDRATRAKGSAKPKAKRGKKAKSAATVDSEGEGSSVADGAEKPKRKGGFTKEYALRYVYRQLLLARVELNCCL